MPISKMRQSIEDEGMNEVGMSFIGGLTFLLSFRDKEYAKVCMDLHEGFSNRFFLSITSGMEEDNSNGSVTIVTSIPPKIDEAVVIKWNNKSIITWVTEVVHKWIPDINVSSMLES
ncbi:hypothetical protein Hanom_Chr03g00214181 [Helianthus anomalus]